jgi:hypothetical protein
MVSTRARQLPVTQITGASLSIRTFLVTDPCLRESSATLTDTVTMSGDPDYKIPYLYLHQGFLHGGLGAALSGEKLKLVSKQLRALAKQNLPTQALSEELIKLAKSLGILRSEAEAAHLENDWFARYFGDQPVAALYLEGFRIATQRAALGDLPIEVYWAASPDKNLVLAVAESKRQVTVVVFTPKPAYRIAVELVEQFDPISIVMARNQRIVVERVPRSVLKDLTPKRKSAKPRAASVKVVSRVRKR